MAVLESFAPGGSSMKGMNLSGKPGIVQPMQIPPTFGQPPMPAIQPRFGTLQLTTGPQQPSFTMHLGDPYSAAKSRCSWCPARALPSCRADQQTHVGRSCAYCGIMGASTET